MLFIKVKLLLAVLLTVMLFLILNVTTNCRFIQPNSTDTITACPKRTAKQATFCSLQFPVYPNGTLALQITDRHGDTVLRRNAQQHVDMVTRSIAFNQFHFFLPTQFTNNFANPLPLFTVKNLLPILRHDYDMVLAVPAYMCHTPPIFHDGSPDALRGLPREDRLIIYTLGTAEPYKFSPAEPVA